MAVTLAMEELIKLIVVGNARALANLHRVMHHRIVTFAIQRLDNTTRAEEVMSETLFEVWKHAPWFAGEARVSMWIAGIARSQNCPTNTVKTRMFDVRHNRHDCMNVHGHEELG